MARPRPSRPSVPAGLLVALAAAVAAAETPSPSTAPGLRLLPEPVISHWPAIVHEDEPRSIAFRIAYHDPGLHARQPGFATPPPQAGDRIRIGWGGALRPDVLPAGREGIGALLPVPGPGDHVAWIMAGTRTASAALRVVPADGPWPLARLRDGHPVDGDDAAVVLRDRRRDRAGERAFRWLDGGPARPLGRAWAVGAVDGLDAAETRLLPADHPTHPHHAALVALADLGREPAPRTILWIPGPGALDSGAWREEDRLLGAVRTRCEALAIAPRLVLALPPEPPQGHPDHAARRRLLRVAARSQEWETIDPWPAGAAGAALATGVESATPAARAGALAVLRAALAR
ncbi:MAG: hypothetical protein RLZZ127_215 [Planctomycetota bacterium]|jgi:hypothetical protein